MDHLVDVFDTMLTLTNSSFQESYWEVPVNYILCSILGLIMLVSIIGNSLVIAVISITKRMRNKTNIFIANLAVADLGVTLLCMPITMATIVAGTFPFNDLVCNYNAFCDGLFLVASIHGLMYVSIQKFFALVFPLKRIITRTRVKCMIIMTWLAALIAASGALLGWTSNTYKPGSSQCGPKYPETPKEYGHGYFNMVFALVIPFSVMFCAYVSIFFAIRGYTKRLRENSSVHADKIFQQQFQVVKTIFILVFTFCIFWSPYFVYLIWILFGEHSNIPDWLNNMAYFSGFANSALNPVIYSWRTASFRKELRRMCCGGSKLSDTPSISYSARSHANNAGRYHPNIYDTFTIRSRGALPHAYSIESFQFMNILLYPEIDLTEIEGYVETYRKPSSPKMNEYPHLNLEDQPPLVIEDEVRNRIFSDSEMRALERRHYGSSVRRPIFRSFMSCPPVTFSENTTEADEL